MGGELRPGAEVGAEEHVRATARGFFHPVGTCAIGQRARRAVPGARLREPLRGGRLGDPDIPAANTNLTTVALAERAAQVD